MSNYGVKRSEHRNWPRPARRSAEAVHVLRPATVTERYLGLAEDYP